MAQKRPSNAERRAYWQRKLAESGKPVITCLECGDLFQALHVHLERVHKITWHEYAIKHSLPLGTRSAHDSLRDTFRQHMLKRIADGRIVPPNAEFLKARVHIPSTYAKMRETKKRPPSAKQIENTKALQSPIIQERAVNSFLATMRHLGKRVSRVCVQCKTQYETRVSSRLHFCNNRCYFAFKQGKPVNQAVPRLNTKGQSNVARNLQMVS